MCRECMRSKFSDKGVCLTCGTYSYEESDRLKKIKEEEKEKK